MNITEKVYSGVATEERDLVPLQYKIKDGNYALEGYIPNLLMSYNNVVMVELLRKMSDKELAAWKEKEEMMLEEAERKAKEAQMNSIASYM